MTIVESKLIYYNLLIKFSSLINFRHKVNPNKAENQFISAERGRLELELAQISKSTSLAQQEAILYSQKVADEKQNMIQETTKALICIFSFSFFMFMMFNTGSGLIFPISMIDFF